MASRKPLKQLKALETDDLDAEIMAKTMTHATGTESAPKAGHTPRAPTAKTADLPTVATESQPPNDKPAAKSYQQVRVTLPNTNKFTVALLSATEKVAERSLTPEEVNHNTVFNAFLKRHEKELCLLLSKMVGRS